MSDLMQLTELTARGLVAALSAREVAAREVLAAHLERIERHNPTVNAVVTFDVDGARAAAAAADEAAAAGRPLGPLHGLPVAIKDTADTAGLRTTWGSRLYDDIAAADDLHVARIRAAGAIRVGKTNVPELAAGSHTFNPVFGATRNPWDLAMTVGGSSGGAAAALTAGFLPIADGSDMGGSLRNPAAFCSVVGFRPSPGVVPDPAAPNMFDPLVTVGPMARTVADTALLLSVMGRPWPAEARTRPIDTTALVDFAPAPLRGLRVAYAPDLDGRVPVDPAIRAVLDRTAEALAGLGARVEPACPDLDGSDDAFRTLRAADFHHSWGRQLAERPDDFNDFLAGNIRAGETVTGAQVMAAYAEVSRLVRAAHRFFGDHDLVLAPVTQVPPFPIETRWPNVVAGQPMSDYLEWMKAAYLFTPLGVPGLSLPAGFTPDGLPVGAQLLGAPGSDVELLRRAATLEEALGVPTLAPLEGITP